MASAPHPGISPEEGWVRELAWGPIGRHWKSLDKVRNVRNTRGKQTEGPKHLIT
jgi:hypothetical protein